ncbi:threonine/serine exporter family protein [Peribacillus frigoritolerans]|uniref:threonine/serine exporter family protein n=1 Tax=Peribacillus frigoritolerans TaxID=450367 RepID=UPI00105A6D1F|nr:threonine/serine exporter family protein [Peribacillus frigoritolerans]TDL77882.1 threonine/serine exporter [Peribacillus frigoritolerans]
MKIQQNYSYEIMEVCLLAGKIMLISGAETYRVEDTMMRIAASYGVKDSHSYVTPTGIIFSIESDQPTKTKLIRIMERTTDLDKVTNVNAISRKISNGELNVDEAYDLLKEIEDAKSTYSLALQVIAAAIASGCFLIMFQGQWSDFFPAVLAGGLGFMAVIYFHRLVPIKFFSEFLASFLIGLLAYLFVMTGLGTEMDKVIIGSVMPLVPGLLLTNAVRDLMAGHLISGLSKGAEAFLTAFAIGSGIAVVFLLF